MIGEIISHYKIIEKIGEGGMGIVYKAKDTKLDRFVALKFLPREFTEDSDAKKRFIREARTASALDHPNICTIYEINEIPDGQIFISMAYYPGETLKKKLKHGPLPVHEALDVAIQISQGMSKAHKIGLVHRDLKPANIIITEDGTVKIIDFGLAKLEGQTRLTKEKSTMGTIAYLSPEQARGKEADHRADIWAAGVVLYEMLTGQSPFKGEYDQVIIYSILHEEPVKVTSISPDIPAECERIIDKALQKETKKRYQQIGQMEKDLKHIKHNLQMDFPKKTNTIYPKQKMKKRFVPIGIALIFIISIFILKPFVFKRKNIEKTISVAVISFENQTGNNAYDYLQDAIPNLLITSLEQSPNLQVTTWERMYDLLKQAGKVDTRVIDKDTGFELCSLDGIDAIVSGSFIKAGDLFATDVKVLDVSTKKLLKSSRSQGTGIESILKNQIDELSSEISKGIVLPEKQIEYTHANIMDVTTTSIEAYHYFVRGRDEYYRGTGDAEKYFKKAIELDTTFATAYLWYGRSYGPDIIQRNKLFMKAKRFSYKAARKEQLYIEAGLETNSEKKIELIHQIIKEYPKEKHAHIILADHYAYLENFGNAIEESQKALELDPYFTPAVTSLCYWYAETGNHVKADEYLKRLAAINPGDAHPMITVANIYYADGRLDAAIQKYNEASEIDPASISEIYASIVLAVKGEFDQAVECINRYIAIDTPYFRVPGGRGWRSYIYFLTGQYRNAFSDIEFSYNRFKEWNNLYYLSLYEALMGHMYFELVNFEKSRIHFYNYEKVRLRKNDQPTFGYVNFTCEPFLGLIDIQQGNLDSARVRLDQMQRILPDIHITVRDIVSQHYQILKAELLLAKDSTNAAIAVGESIKELTLPRYYNDPDRILFYNLPYSKDILARAYLKKGDIDKAIAEYERLLHFNPAGKDRRIMNPKYHYAVAKLYQQKGQKSRAIQHLTRFLELWKNADEDIPELIDARKRVMELTSHP